MNVRNKLFFVEYDGGKNIAFIYEVCCSREIIGHYRGSARKRSDTFTSLIYRCMYVCVIIYT